ncbi:MAG: alpha-amylase family protein [Armatimonadota bacterium]
MSSSTRVIKIGKDATLALRLGARKEWRGIGEITVHGVELRDGDHPMVVRLDTPDGYLYTQYFLEKVNRKKGGVVEVHFRALGYPWGRQEYMDEYEQNMYSLQLSHSPVEDTLILKLAPAKLELGERAWAGFSYAFEFKSHKRQAHRLLVHGSWELGGSIVGNTVLQQGQCNMPVYQGVKKTLFTSTCLKTLAGYGSPQGVSFQLAPRGGLLQGFDFQYGKKGALLQYWPGFNNIASLIESPAGSTLLQVVDEYRFPLANHAETAPQYVLFAPGKLAEHEARDLWWDAYQHVYGGIRQQYGVRESVVRPELAKMYSVRIDDNQLKMAIGGVEVHHTEVPYAIGDHLLPKLAKLGIRRFWPEVMTESDVTQFGMKRKADDGIHGDLHCSSVCATHRFLPAEFWGGLKGWKYMADKAHELGMEIGSWFAPHFSPNAPIFREHPEWRIIGPASTTYGGGYGFMTLNMVDWNTGIFDWVLADVKRWKEEAGLDYLWSDSYSNLGLLMGNYAAGMRDNFDALGRLYGEFTKLGLNALSFESVSPFGLMACGFADLRGDKFEQDKSVAGQNDFGWWVNHEDMGFNVSMYSVYPRNRSEEELRDIQFRMMANRGYVMMQNLITNNCEIPDWWVALNHAYEQALPHMKTRRLLPDNAGVRWLDGDRQILWTYRDQELPVDIDAHVEELVGEDARTINHLGVLAAKGCGVYRVTQS